MARGNAVSIVPAHTPPPDMPWFGMLRHLINPAITAHDMDSMRESIARGRMAEWREKYGER